MFRMSGNTDSDQVYPRQIIFRDEDLDGSSYLQLFQQLIVHKLRIKTI